MVSAAANQVRGRRVRWLLGAVTVAVIILNSPVSRRLPLVVQDACFSVLLCLLVLFTGMAWWQFAHLPRDGAWSDWRVWASLAGCIALSLAIAIPVLAVFLFFLRWDFLTAWLVSSMASLLLGFLAKGPVRFPLVIGGGAMVSLVVLIPKGIL